jgi:hypothetical protein
MKFFIYKGVRYEKSEKGWCQECDIGQHDGCENCCPISDDYLEGCWKKAADQTNILADGVEE